MKTINFPYIAAALGLFLLLVVMKGSENGSDGVTALPLLTLLIINECAFFLTLAGTYIGLKNIRCNDFNSRLKIFYAITTALCILLTIQFILLGIDLWPV